jgi:uncharacterized protein YndB with AHSA1/START domain
VTPGRHGLAAIEFPTDLEILIARDFDAPIELVFDVFTKPEHVRKTFAPYGEEVKECSIDLRVGGHYRLVFVTGDGRECAFTGTYLEVDPPVRTVQTWLFDGWPDAHAVESVVLQAKPGVTTVTYSLAFHDQAGRDRMTKYDGLVANLDNVEALLQSLLRSNGGAASR